MPTRNLTSLLPRRVQCLWGGGKEAGRNYQSPAVRKGARGPIMLRIFFVFLSSVTTCRLYKLTISHQPKSHCNWQSLRFGINIFSRSALAGDPNPLSVALIVYQCYVWDLMVSLRWTLYILVTKVTCRRNLPSTALGQTAAWKFATMTNSTPHSN